MKRNVDAVNGTIDSVGGAISLLWNWLGKDPNPPKPEEPSALSKVAGVVSDVRVLAGIAQEVSKPAKPREVRIPPVVVDVEGEEV